ncbi:MAG: hypothetical protein E3K36_06350 [Candidatus Brocadia sp.]|nr:hypothetical protein [Candidatus Brocadia sp.]
MVNNINPSASKLLEQIKRLSAGATQKENNHLDFKKEVLDNHTHNINILKGTNLSNLEKIQKKNDVSIQLVEDSKRKSSGKDIQTVKQPNLANTEKNLRRELVGSFLDIYL